MPFDRSDPMTPSSGWPTAVRGLLAIVFGIIALTSPRATALAFVILFAIWAFADAVFAFVTAARRGRAGERWGWFVFEGIVSAAAGVLALAFPGLTILALTILVAVRAIVLGIASLAAVIGLRGAPHRWLYGLTGIVSVLFGILIALHPMVGALALIWTIGMYAVIIGVMTIALGIHAHMRRKRESREEEEPSAQRWRQAPPAPAQG
jgi:uncharacterized membrane protein HdeD (DUF308 family)